MTRAEAIAALEAKLTEVEAVDIAMQICGHHHLPPGFVLFRQETLRDIITGLKNEEPSEVPVAP